MQSTFNRFLICIVCGLAGSALAMKYQAYAFIIGWTSAIIFNAIVRKDNT